MMVNLPEEFRGLPMGDLIGGPLMGASDAQVRLANAAASFIQQVGFKPAAPASPQETVYRITPPTDEESAKRVMLGVPLLTIVPLPSLSVDPVTVTLDSERRPEVDGVEPGR